MKIILVICSLLCVASTYTLASQRNVLVEMFTNSHCTVCPGAHTALNSFASTSPNAGRVRYIFYHTLFPYSDDQLAQANTTEPASRNSYYNGPTSTPNTFFDGINQGRTYSSFAASLDARMSTESPVEIMLSGSKNGITLSVSASLKKTGMINETDLVAHIIAVEHVSYVGYVMRKMLTGTSGQSFQFDQSNNAVVTSSATLGNVSDISKTGIVVFIQSTSTKTVYQSEYIAYSTLTGAKDGKQNTPRSFELNQNFPNPFNPETTIQYSVPTSSHVVVSVYDVLGNRVATLVDKQQPAQTYTIQFDGSRFSSGVYLYKLTVNGMSLTRRMMLIK
ncbi:MAG: T9SS type A sorting domain-containing protein [Ignavibacteriales bacterium]|nr:T9SS type A sorting domain-containing protein [Ignavibacteriales bacterium]